ncbi:hypothetical protein C8R47DRAFT_1260482 [Mycena vitilis]|nr:hypothetical protein C8R47DRAFT_1260482 [Mycena vitilis]
MQLLPVAFFTILATGTAGPPTVSNPASRASDTIRSSNSCGGPNTSTQICAHMQTYGSGKQISQDFSVAALHSLLDEWFTVVLEGTLAGQDLLHTTHTAEVVLHTSIGLDNPPKHQYQQALRLVRGGRRFICAADAGLECWTVTDISLVWTWNVVVDGRFQEFELEVPDISAANIFRWLLEDHMGPGSQLYRTLRHDSRSALLKMFPNPPVFIIEDEPVSLLLSSLSSKSIAAVNAVVSVGVQDKQMPLRDNDTWRTYLPVRSPRYLSVPETRAVAAPATILRPRITQGAIEEALREMVLHATSIGPQMSQGWMYKAEAYPVLPAIVAVHWHNNNGTRVAGAPDKNAISI